MRTSFEDFLERLTWRQTVLGVLLLASLLYIPFAGTYGLWDPWETHYGEVAREMTRRGDYVRLYWAGSPIDPENFWSKPVLTFWIMSLAMHVAGLARADAPAGEMALSSRPEWALRLPFCLMALLALYGVYLVVARFVSRRAGALAAVALATMPMFSLIARQAMTDMPFVGPMTLALALAALALFDPTDGEAELPRRHVAWRRLRVEWPHHGAFYAAVASFAVTALPQLVIGIAQSQWHIPHTDKHLPGIVLMLPWLLGTGVFFTFVGRLRYKAPLYLITAGVLAGLAVLAKGLAGLGLPVIILVNYLVFTWNWRRLARPQLTTGLLLALLACAIVAVPWHHMMIAQYGKPFWSELYGDNHWRRLVLGRHGDRGGFEYFLRELGYAVLPWIAVAPSALLWCAMRRPRATTAAGTRDVRQDVFWFGAIWFVSAYAVVSFSMTKFHHYILPALPGLAICIGCFLDDVLSRGRGHVFTLVGLLGVPVLALVLFDLTSAQNGPQRFLWLFSYDYINAPKGRTWPTQLNYIPALLGFGGAFALATLSLGSRFTRRGAVAALAVLACAFTVFLLDVFIPQTSRVWSQKGLIATYYKERHSADEPLIAWQMYWRGENFYTSNEIFEGPRERRTVFLGDRNAEDLKDYLGRNRGKRVFFVVEKIRWATLRSLVPEYARDTLRVLDEANNKFELGVAQL